MRPTAAALSAMCGAEAGSTRTAAPRWMARQSASGTVPGTSRISVIGHSRCGHGAGSAPCDRQARRDDRHRSEEHTSELQSLMRISYAVFCLKKKKKNKLPVLKNTYKEQ